jgi:subtilisin family serine protease
MQVAPVSPPGWALDRINQHVLPLDGSKSTACTNPGYGVSLYIIDSGIWSESFWSDPNHPVPTIEPEFGTRLRYLYTFRADGSYLDDLDHGTKVASIAAGNTYGVAPGADVVILKVVGNGTVAQISHALLAIDAIVAEQMSSPSVPRVVNMSLDYASSTLLDNKITDAISRGIVFVVGAGNGDKNQAMTPIKACDAGSPAHLGPPNSPTNPTSYSTITVSATMLPSPWNQDSRVGYANYGDCVDLFAPGQDIDVLSASRTVSHTFGGTSAATPFVSGLAARGLVALGGPYPKSAGVVEGLLKSTTWSTPNVVYDPMTTAPLFIYSPGIRCRP